MVYTCFACKWRSDTVPKRSFHKFPSDTKLKRKWLKLIGQSGATVGTRTTLCSIHFEISCFRYGLDGEKKYLKEGSLPSLHLDTGREIQAKWKALRDSYRRTVRIQERDKQLGLEPSRRSKYYYFDQLNFLAEHCGPKSSKKSSQTSEFKMEEDETMENSNDFSAEESTTWEKNPLEESESVEIKIEPQPSEMSMFMENFENSPRKRSEESDELNQRLVSVLEEMVALQRPDKEDVMGDKGFLLSLLPFMQKLSNEENLRVRIEFMKVLQNNGSRKKN